MDESNVLNSEERMDFLREEIKTKSIMALIGITKDPKEDDWSKYSVDIRPTWLDELYGCNAAIITGPASDRLVLDKDNIPLFESIKKRHNLENPPTYTVETGRGVHEHYRYPDNGKTYGNKSIKTIGVDFRGKGGYVLAPYSVHQETGKIYKVIDPRDPVPAPQWMLDLCENGTPSEWTFKNPEKLNLPDHILSMIMEPTLPGMRSDAIMSVLNSLASRGLSDDQIYCIFYRYPIGDKFMDKGQNRDAWLQPQINKAREFVGKAQAKKTVEKPVEEISVVSGLDLKDLEIDNTPLIDNLLESECGSLFVVGPSGVGKSTFLLNLALGAANPQPNGIFGRFKAQDPLTTVFIQAENAVSHISSQVKSIARVDKQLAAGLDHIFFSRFKDKFPLTGFDLKSSQFRDYVMRLKELTDADILIIDPFSCYLGGDENNNYETRRSLDITSEVCNDAELAVIIGHHTGKAGYEGLRSARGATSMIDWTSNMINLKSEKIKDTSYIKVTNEKSRTFAPFKPFYLARNQHHIMVPIDPDATLTDKDMIDLLKDNNGSFGTKVEFVKAIRDTHKCAAKTARACIDRVVTNKLVVIQKGDGNAKVYTLSTK